MNDHPVRSFRRAVLVLVGLLAATALTRCAQPPEELPVPPVPPVVVVPPVPSVRSAGMQTAYDEADARLRAYRGQPACAASGPVACYDPAISHRVELAERRAHAALESIAVSRAALRTARAKIETFRAAAEQLTVGDK